MSGVQPEAQEGAEQPSDRSVDTKLWHYQESQVPAAGGQTGPLPPPPPQRGSLELRVLKSRAQLLLPRRAPTALALHSH